MVRQQHEQGRWLSWGRGTDRPGQGCDGDPGMKHAETAGVPPRRRREGRERSGQESWRTTSDIASGKFCPTVPRHIHGPNSNLSALLAEEDRNAVLHPARSPGRVSHVVGKGSRFCFPRHLVVQATGTCHQVTPAARCGVVHQTSLSRYLPHEWHWLVTSIRGLLHLTSSYVVATSGTGQKTPG